jgi:PIN domain nuclease of toxin-antitoxin system
MQLKNKVLFDSSALLTLIQQETGYEELEEVVANAVISSVNLSEVISVLSRSMVPSEKIKEVINSSITDVVPFSWDEAILSGELINQTKAFGLSLGDRACIATGILYNLKVYTTDQIWRKLKLKGFELVLVRDKVRK